MSQSRDDVIRQIESAFADRQPPRTFRDNDEGDEPRLVEAEFRDKRDWRGLPSRFLDAAPDGYGSALSFFSDEAYCFYLPAYLIAELRHELASVDVWYHLTHGLGHAREEKINPTRYGDATWWDRATLRHASLSSEQRLAILAALELYLAGGPIEADEVTQALETYWRVDPPPLGGPVVDRW